MDTNDLDAGSTATDDGATSDAPEAPVEADEATRRRELIELAVRRRTDLTPETLRGLLKSLDVEVDAVTLAADLKALHIDAVTDDQGATVLRHDPDATAAATGSASHVEGFYPPDHETPLRNPTVLAAIGVGVVIIVILLAIVLFGGDSKKDAGTPSGSNPPATTPAVPGGGGGTTAIPLAYAPVGPGSDAALKIATDGVEHFDTTGDSLGTFPDVGPWVIGGGTWKVTSNGAALDQGAAKGMSVAYVDAGTADLRAQVKIVKPFGGAGIAFRIVDAKNFWLWAVTPRFATVSLIKVIDGVPYPAVNSGLINLPPGSEIGVNLLGPKVELLARGAVVKTVTDTSAKPGHGLGVAAIPGTAGAVFDDLIFKRG